MKFFCVTQQVTQTKFLDFDDFGRVLQRTKLKKVVSVHLEVLPNAFFNDLLSSSYRRITIYVLNQLQNYIQGYDTRVVTHRHILVF